jgi:hypothetical protein
VPKLILAALLLSGCSTIADIGRAIDDVCVVGKLSAEDAVFLNSHHDKWVMLKAKPGDRVVNSECSDLSHQVTQGN